MDFNEVITYPMERENWVKTVLIGGVLSFFGFLLLPLFVVYGYVVRTIDGSLEGSSEPPAFEDWGGLLVDGLQAWIIGIIYLIIPVIVAFVTIGGSIAAMATGGRAGAAAGIGGMMVGLVLTFILSLAFGYLAVAAIVNFAREGQFGAAFDFDVIKSVVFDREYAVAWLVSVAIFFVAGLVNVIPFIGWILTPFVGFYAAVVAADLWADGFARALESSSGVDRTRDEEPAV
jgi:hypothetical protein